MKIYTGSVSALKKPRCAARLCRDLKSPEPEGVPVMRPCFCLASNSSRVIAPLSSSSSYRLRRPRPRPLDLPLPRRPPSCSTHEDLGDFSKLSYRRRLSDIMHGSVTGSYMVSRECCKQGTGKRLETVESLMPLRLALAACSLLTFICLIPHALSSQPWQA